MSIEIFNKYCRICINRYFCVLNWTRKERDMLKINFEFRKGIFFIRLIGNLNNKNYITKDSFLKELIIENKFKYVVINTNYY